MAFELDYDEFIPLDAESLAETGIREAYESLLPELRKHVSQPLAVEEIIDSNVPSYTVKCGKMVFPIYGTGLDEKKGGGWGRATCAFFSIVNAQLVGSELRFYAINGGNDLGGMFLTPAQAKDSQASLPDRKDWPYLPVSGESWGGQYH